MVNKPEDLTVKTAITRGAQGAWDDFWLPWQQLATQVLWLFRRVGH